MKKQVIIKVGNKEYTLCFTIAKMDKLEGMLGRSLISILSSVVNLLPKLDINFTACSLICGLEGKQLNKEQAYDVIQDYCDAGGSIDDLNGSIIEAICKTGLFTRGAAVKEAEAPEKIEEKK